jgi:hypothetical protein
MSGNENIPVQPRATPGSELLKHVRLVVLSGRSAIIPGHRVHRVFGLGQNVLTNKCVYRRRFRMINRSSRPIWEPKFQLIELQI